MKIVINNCYGGFGLSEKAIFRLAELKGITLYPEDGKYGLKTYYTVPVNERTPELADWHSASMEDRQAANEAYTREHFYARDLPRDDAQLVHVVEELGAKEASGDYAELKIVEIPDNVEWEIAEYDGSEWVSEKHRVWS